MNHQKMVKPAIIAAIVLVGLVIIGLPMTYLAFLLVIIACPLMMYFMMRGMGGMHGNGQDDPDRKQGENPADHDQAGSRHVK